MGADPHRCPECDFELWYVRAGHMLHRALIGPNGAEMTLHSTDAIVCTRCRWWRPATADDHPVTDLWKGRVR